VDMEGKLRDDGDWFDLDRASRCAEIFEKWQRGRAAQ
jgi:hypothetical protein